MVELKTIRKQTKTGPKIQAGGKDKNCICILATSSDIFLSYL